MFAKIKAWDFDKVQSVYAKSGDMKRFLDLTATFGVKGKGTVGDGLNLGMKANVSKFTLDMGALTVSGKGIVLDAKVTGDAKDMDGAHAKDGSVVATAKELDLGIDLGAVPTDPVELAKYKKEKARLEANAAEQKAAWERFNGGGKG